MFIIYGSLNYALAGTLGALFFERAHGVFQPRRIIEKEKKLLLDIN